MDRTETAKRKHPLRDRKSTRLNSSHSQISYAVFCLKKKQELLHRQDALAERGVAVPTLAAVVGEGDVRHAFCERALDDDGVDLGYSSERRLCGTLRYEVLRQQKLDAFRPACFDDLEVARRLEPPERPPGNSVRLS